MARCWAPGIALVLFVCCSSGHAQTRRIVSAADPAVIASAEGESGYYVFATGRGIAIWHSDNLVDWTKIGTVFDEAVPGWAKRMVPKSKGIWAPDVSYFAGNYHLYYAVSSFGSQRSAIGLATNATLDPSDPNYAWEDRGLVLQSAPGKNDFNAIDPALLVDQEGDAYLFWGSYWTGLKVLRIDPRTGKPFPQDNPVVPVAARAPGTNPPAIEAPYVMFHDGFYYLFVSWDFCCAGAKSTYKVMVGRSRRPIGPYVDADGRPMTEGGGTRLLASGGRWAGPGHNSVLSTDRGDYLVHHTYDKKHLQAKRILQIRPIRWGKDGWPAVGKPLAMP